MTTPVLEYLANLAGERALAANTIAAYRQDLSQAIAFFAGLGRCRWEQISGKDLADFLADLQLQGKAPTTQARLLSSLRGLYRFFRDQGENPGRDPTQLAGRIRLWRTLPDILSPEQALQVLHAPSRQTWQGLRDRALLALLYGGGLRVSEACGLRLEDLNLELDSSHCVLRVTGKGQKERLVPFEGGGRLAVEDWLQEGRPTRALKPAKRPPWVLLSRTGKQLDRVRAFRIVRHWAVQCGLPASLHPHVLRHSCATHLLAGGGDLRGVQEFLGHTDLSTTERYTHVDVEDLRAEHRRLHPRARNEKRKSK